jgi:cell division inhibitor SepF
MAGVFRKAANWLGLVDDERYAYTAEEDDEISQEVALDEDEEEEPPRGTITVLPTSRPRGDDARALPVLVTAHSFEDAADIGNHYRHGTAVAMNLAAMPTAEARRVLDFNSGMVFAMGGKIEKLSGKLFLLTPHGLTVDAAERDRLVGSLVKAS